MPNSKQIVYLSQSQYAELVANGTITVDGVTVTYDENDIYVTPQAEPVTDVRVDGTSISSNGIANIPLASQSSLGVVKQAGTGYSISIQNDGTLKVVGADTATIKISNSNSSRPILPATTHVAAFYGLTRAAGVDMASSDNAIGTYTPEAKGAIQQMLGVSDLIAPAENTLVASKAYAIGDVFTANGKLYKATAAIAADAAIITDGANANCEETNVGDGFPHDVQINGTSIVSNGVANVPLVGDGNNVVGACQINSTYGIGTNNLGRLYLAKTSSAQIKTGTYEYKAIVPYNQHEAAFYGLAKAAGDTTQSQSDNAVGTYTDDAKAAIRAMLSAVGDVQINSTSIVSNGIANIPVASTTDYGAIKIGNSVSTGLTLDPSGYLKTSIAYVSEIKAGTNGYKPIVPTNQHAAVFYGLATAAGDITQSSSSNAVGTYTDNAKASIKSMLGIVDGSTGTVDVTGAAPTITAVENTRYVCGEVTSLTITPAASGICIIRFTSGSTPTLLTLPSTVKFPEWFDATTLETDTIYEICITDGVYGAVMSWAL